MNEFRYMAWTVKGTEALVGNNGSTLRVALDTSHNVFHGEAWWPHKPSTPPQTVVGGICLWDARWQLIFKQPSKKQPAAVRTLAFPREREDAFKRLAKGKQVECIRIPTEPGPYHVKLAAWFGEKVRELEVRRVLCHIPHREYSYHIAELESGMGQQLPVLYHKLDAFAEQVYGIVRSAVGDAAEVIFVHPMDHFKGIAPMESYTKPYLFPEKFGIAREGLVAVEDLVELRIAQNAQAQGDCAVNHVLGGVIGNPHPYTLKEGPSETIAVSELV